MKPQITVAILAASMLMTQVACGHKMQSRRSEAGPTAKPAADKVPGDKATPAAEKVASNPECPQNVEGLWEVRKSTQSSGFWDISKYIKVTPEFFSIGRNDKGVLQLIKGDLTDSIVFDGQPRSIGSKDRRGSPNGEVAVYSAKCVAGVVFVTEKNGTEVQKYEYRLSGEDLTGLRLTTSGDKTTGELLSKSTATPDAGV